MTHRRLVLMRHAKSDQDAADDLGRPLPDHARPLAPRGLRAAPRVGAWLRDQGWSPDAVVLSDAARTTQTWRAMAGLFAPGLPVLPSPRLYLAGLGALRAEASGWPPGWETVLALGHNPGWELAATQLCGQRVELKTASCALLEGQGPTWSAALGAPWRLVRVVHPRALPR